ncbi:asparaginase [Litoreibacter roseus]|uniref:Asparaginase n=1 Tax=Litoreibacter roseus TaxID=2601869 RepID=A0A6N6JGX1_9RHOB|nr:asparaginase [Litoreibacter roseus]GFE64462.1 hypothetical protein KIN_15360 [Litoreibacter roseus]
MTQPARMLEIWRGDLLESLHLGHAVVCNTAGEVVEAWGDAEVVIYPRSSCKMVQALPLIESGAADRFGLTSEHLALACASHEGAAMHADRVGAWLGNLELSEGDLRCGVQAPSDKDMAEQLIRAQDKPCQLHNNCSGKHAGFLTLGRHLNARPEYLEIDHPVQLAVRDAFENMTGLVSPTYGIDGCSAPNFATTLTGLARAAAQMVSKTSDARGVAAKRLVEAMIAHPDLVAGKGRACTELMGAANGQAAIKTGAEGVFIAILPGKQLGIALKIVDGATRASEASIAALLVRYGVLDPDDPLVQKRTVGPITNWRGLVTGRMQVDPALTAK